MPNASLFSCEHSDWRPDFDAQNSTLSLRHGALQGSVRGKLCFRAGKDGGGEEWSLDAPRDSIPGRLSLIDTQGNVQGYVSFQADGSRFQALLLHRAAQSFSGALVFSGTARLGPDAFACRARPTGPRHVVQMASGPADSALNNALFCPDTDTALLLEGDRVTIATREEDDPESSVFAVELAARAEDAAASSLTIELVPDFYRNHYVPHYRPIDKQRCPSPPTGWMSWNVYFDTAGEKENLDEARVAAEHLLPFGLGIWSIESWQANSDKLPVRTFHNLNLQPHGGQFPHGMAWLADQIRKLGFRPGIWTAPFGTGSEVFYREHRDWFLHDADGEPMSNWCGIYLLDPSQPAVRAHMRDMHRTMAEDWGYEFFKVDGMSGRSHSYSAHFYERPEVRAAFRDPCEKPFELCVQALREGVGPDRILLACQGHYSGCDAAYADAGRIGGDIVSPNRASTWHNVLAQARATLNQLFVHNIVWYGDPDTLLVGDYHPLEHARVTTTVVALPGQMMFAGDKLGQLRPERMRLLQQTLPVCDVRPLDLFPMFELAPVWDLKVHRPFGSWDVISLFNWSDDEQLLGFDFADLGLSAAETYATFDFWNREYLGGFRERFETRVPPQSNVLLSAWKLARRPQFLATDRHVTQGGTSLLGLEWDAASGVLSGETQLVGGHPATLYLLVPEPFIFVSAEAGPPAEARTEVGDDGVVALELTAARTGPVTWSLTASGPHLL